MQVFFDAARPHLLLLTAVSLAYSLYLVYRRPFCPRPVVRRVWASALRALLRVAVPLFRGLLL